MAQPPELSATQIQAQIDHAESENPWPQTHLSALVDGVIRRIGDTLAWVWILLLSVVVLNVTLRYVFGEGHIELEELQWHLYSIGFLCGLSYCLESDDHIRVDFLRAHFSPRLRAWIELYGLLLLLLPFCALILIYSLPFVLSSFYIAEVSVAPGGLPYRWAIKACLLAGFALVGLAAMARILRVWSYLFADAAPPPASPPASSDRTEEG